jgi:hypothetical protein
MADAVITVRNRRFSNVEAYGIVRHMYLAIDGRAGDRYGFSAIFWGAIAHSLYQSIYSAFLVKSSHGTDSLGNYWKDIKPETKAYSRPKARIGLTLPGPKYRPTLPPGLDKVWRRVYARNFSRLALVMDEDDARGIAAAKAWNTVKDMGAWTLIGTLGVKQMPLLNRTGRLEESLVPNPLSSGGFGAGQYEPANADQIFRIASGSLEIGTKVEYAEAVSVKRPIWPRRIGPWMEQAVEAGRDAIFTHLRIVIAARAT